MCYYGNMIFHSSNKINQIEFKDDQIFSSQFSCAIGLRGSCGHVIGLLYLLTDYKKKICPQFLKLVLHLIFYCLMNLVRC